MRLKSWPDRVSVIFLVNKTWVKTHDSIKCVSVRVHVESQVKSDIEYGPCIVFPAMATRAPSD